MGDGDWVVKEGSRVESEEAVQTRRKGGSVGGV